jgi:beta-phosphoglucomutase-like phosphatase (HAD superfamily)
LLVPQAELAQAKWAQQTHEAQLKGQPLWPAVDRLEGQLKQIQRQCALARDAIRAHQDAGHEVLLPQVLGLVEELNQAHIAAVMAV